MKMKKIISSIITITLFTQVFSPIVYATEQALEVTEATTDNETTKVEEESPQEEASTDSPQEEIVDLLQSEQENSKSSEEIQNKSSEIEKTPQVKEMTASDATFEGQSLKDENLLSYTWDQFMGAERFNKNLTISAKFDSLPRSDKKITIKLSEEFQYASLPGFKASGGKLVFDAATLPSQLKAVITNATIDYPSIYGKHLQGSTGTVTYELANGTVETSFNITLGVNSRFIINEDGREYTNPIEVSYSEAGNENFYHEKVENIFLLPGSPILPRFFVSGVSQYKTIYQSQTGTFMTGYGNFMTTGGQAIESMGAYIDTLTYEVKYSKELDLKKAVFQNSPLTSIQELPEDENFKYALITVNQARASGTVSYELAFADGVDPTTIEAGTKFIVASTGNISYTAYKREPVTDAKLIAGISVGIQVIKNFENELTSGNLTRMISKNSESSYTFLGQFNIANKQPQKVTDQKFQASFDTKQVNVQAVRIGTRGGKTADIKLTTTTGRIISIPDNPSTSPVNQIVDIANYSPETDEYIAAIEWTDDVPANFQMQAAVYGVDGIQYYGLLKEDVAVGNTITNQLKYGGIDTFNSNNKMTESIISVTNGNVFPPKILSNGATILAGNKGNLRTVLRLKEDSPVNTLSGFKGINIYVRELNGININPSDFKAVDALGREYNVADGSVQVTYFKDNTGTKVYQFQIPEYDVNNALPQKVEKQYINVGFSTSKNSTAASYSVADILFFEPMNTSFVIYNVGPLLGTNVNKYEIGTKTKNSLIMTGTPAQVLNIQKNIDFNVTTSANINDGPFIDYQGTPDTIINMNPEGRAKYGLKLLNNSGQTVNGYQAIIPIPKRGETTDPAFQLQDENFGWTVHLTKPLDLSNNSYQYTVLYATNYELDFASTNWKTWDEISDKKEIRSVSIQTKDEILSTESATPDNPGEDFITFDIEMDKATADEDAGKINIYKALIRKEIQGNITNNASEAVAIRLKTGVVKGQVYNDLNRNAVLDENETGVDGITVIAYKKGTKTEIESTTTKTIDGVKGMYTFLGLDKSQQIDVTFVQEHSDDSQRFVGTSDITLSSDQQEATIKNITASDVGSDQVSIGMMTPIKVTYNPQGGTSSVTEEFAGYPDDLSKINQAPTATKEGYTLDGWYTEAEGGNKVTFPYEANGKEDVTLYAHYVAKKYQVSYNISENAGEGTAPTDEMVSYLSTITKPADPKKTGYNFVGWFDAAVDGTKWDFATDKMPAKNMTLYAQFSVGTYRLTFDNEGETSVQTVSYDEFAAAPASPTKEGHTFIGWFDAKTGGTKWEFATNKMPAKDMTLYARYTVNSYTTTFDNQGILSTQTSPFGSLLTEPTEPTKAGYSFAGWKESFSNKLWNFKKDTVPAKDITLVAQFTALKQTITFDVNGGDATSKPDDVEAATDSSVDLDQVSHPVKIGYQFVGWFDANDNQISGTITMPIGGLALTAHWTEAEQVIIFNANGGTGVPSIKALTNASIDIDEQTTTRNGYTFLGWYDAADTLVSGIQTVPAGGAVYTAKWHAEDQTITFDVNEGDLASQPEDITSPTDSEIMIDEVTIPTRFGYKFTGWYDETGNQVSGRIKMPAGGMNLKAEWIDSIEAGIWKIEAENIEMTMDEFIALREENTLESEILTRSKAKAWDNETTVTLLPLTVDIGELATKATPGEYIVNITYAPTAEAPQTRAVEPTNQPSELTTAIQVTLVEPKDKEKETVPEKETEIEKETEKDKSQTEQLPLTGEALQSYLLWLGLGLVIVVIYLRKKWKNETN